MSAIVSLLRVMTYRDAEAITLEVGKVPALRRRGQVEGLAMPALEVRMLEEFVIPVVDGKQLEQGPVMVSFTDADGTMYPATVERAPGGIRAIVKKPVPPKKAAPPPPPAPPASQPAREGVAVAPPVTIEKPNCTTAADSADERYRL